MSSCKQYKPWAPAQSFLLPPSPLDWLPKGHLAYFVLDVLGEPDATVTIEPAVDPELGPIYFNMVRHDVICPDRKFDRTSDDGGVLFVNVPPATYTLRAHKEGVTFREVTIKCRPGLVVNAAPPWGLQALEGGIGPRE